RSFRILQGHRQRIRQGRLGWGGFGSNGRSRTAGRRSGFCFTGTAEYSRCESVDGRTAVIGYPDCIQMGWRIFAATAAGWRHWGFRGTPTVAELQWAFLRFRLHNSANSLTGHEFTARITRGFSRNEAEFLLDPPGGRA